jgi:hypothetical protein
MYQESGGVAKALSLIAAVPDTSSALSSKDFFPLSLLEIFGVFAAVLLILCVFDLLINFKQYKTRLVNTRPVGIAVVLLWFLAELAGSTALAEINYFFRIRYSFILIIPTAVLFAALITHLLQRQFFKPAWRYSILCLLLTIPLLFQLKQNFIRGLQYRSSLGGVMSVIDQAYRYIDQELPSATILLLPGFLNYAAPINASPALNNRIQIAAPEEIAKYQSDTTYGLAWGSAPIANFKAVKTFTGCTSFELLNLPGCASPLTLYQLSIAIDRNT